VPEFEMDEEMFRRELETVLNEDAIKARALVKGIAVGLMLAGGAMFAYGTIKRLAKEERYPYSNDEEV
jgi:hypothetical protein